MGFTSEWWEKSRQIQERLPAACWLGNLICETLIVQSKLPPSNFLHYIALGTIHLSRRHILGGRGQKLAKFANGREVGVKNRAAKAAAVELATLYSTRDHP